MTGPQRFLIYQSEDGSTRIDVMLEAETLWLNQKQLTELFGKAKGTISEHIKHIFEDGELDEHSVVRLFRTTAADGKQHEVAHYNLDMVPALGFETQCVSNQERRNGTQRVPNWRFITRRVMNHRLCARNCPDALPAAPGHRGSHVFLSGRECLTKHS